MGQYWRMRIVSLLPSATEIVYALGLDEHLVGVTDECDWPPQARTVRVVSHSALPAAAEPAEIDRLVSASIGADQPLYRLDTDAIRDLRPDLVLSQDLCAVCAVPSGHVNQALDVLGCQAEVISLDPSSLDEVLDGVLQVGKAAGVEQRAHEVVTGLRERLASVRPPSRGWSGPGCSRWSGGIRRSTAGTGCRRCCSSPAPKPSSPLRVPRRCG
jgi:iron complex transport system substrate-binding protein